jgi:hypothetical protein
VARRAGFGTRAATVIVVPLVALLAGRRSLDRRGGVREATGLVIVPVPLVRRRAALAGRRAWGFAGGSFRNAAALSVVVVPEFVRLTVRTASGHEWEDRGEKSKRDEKASDESHART